MNRIFYLVSIVCCSNLVSSQDTAFFETLIYVEDAIGNVDSVVIGHDPDANYEYNPQFDEFDITEPFDSVFEVRAAHYGPSCCAHHEDIVLSKRIIGHVEASSYYPPWQCYLATESIVLFIHARYQPVTVRWHVPDFNDGNCRKGSILTSHYLNYVTPYWMEEDTALALTACLAEDSSYTQYLFDYGDFGFWKYEEIEGKGLDTVFAMLVTLYHAGNMLTPCTGTVSDGVIYSSSQEKPMLFANPVNDVLNIHSNEASIKYQLYNLNGSTLMSGSGTSIALHSLPSGIYLVRLINTDGTRSLHKIVKQ